MWVGAFSNTAEGRRGKNLLRSGSNRFNIELKKLMGSAKQLFVHDDGVILQKVSVQTLNPKRCGIHIAAVTFTIIIANIEEVDGLVEKKLCRMKAGFCTKHF